MDKNTLIVTLAYKLEQGGIKREFAISEAKAFVASLSGEEADKLVSLIDNDVVMSRIAETLKKKLISEHAANTASIMRIEPSARTAEEQPEKQEQTQTPVPAPADEDDELSEMLSPDRAKRSESAPSTVSAPNPVKNEPMTAPRPAQPPQNGGGSPSKQQQPQHRPEPVSPQRIFGADEPASAVKPEPKKRIEVKKEKKEKKIIYRPDPNADYRKFYIILGCSSPIWIFIGLLGITLFLLVLGALCVSTILLIAALIAGTAIGTVVSLIGLVYGATQLFNYAPIGLYEIGLGLVIGGVTMLSGIVAYNVAIRLIPFLIKQLFALFVFAIRKCVELYFYVKGACADL